MQQPMDRDKILALLDQILEMELAGMVRYIHYSFMVYGPARQPLIAWLEQEAGTSLRHAHAAGEMITHLGGHPSLAIGPLLETHRHHIGDILQETREWEQEGLNLYKILLQAAGESRLLVQYATAAIAEEAAHVAELTHLLNISNDEVRMTSDE